ncbi:putative toxin-antitoxin system toxin component, PIN family [Hymenobacter caeli]|uniref:PIN family toxin of toxin-antitoxin system n=1 Tax=Hymenobacter caeli TaxID=2735894 RepID=A0ABX2FL79_9BACT|nr:PIN domain-containing protein [Hymenobacter caeli]NRT17346.1 putative PIN family toxin of toxin-antitoxin system [Hymenobacter caeli]
MRVVFDANVLLVALPSHSPFHALYRAVVDGRLTLFATTETLAEYEEQIGRRLGLARTDIQLRELLNLPSVRELTVYYQWHLLAEVDADDDKFVDCTIACGADYLVTNDRPFDKLRHVPFPTVHTIRAKDFLNLL